MITQEHKDAIIRTQNEFCGAYGRYCTDCPFRNNDECLQIQISNKIIALKNKCKECGHEL